MALVREPWTTRLRPRSNQVARSSAAPDVLARALAVLGPGPVAWAAESGAGLHAELRRSGGGRTGSRGIETELLSLLLQLHEGRGVAELRVAEAALDDARLLAREGVSSTVLVEAVWRLHRLVQEAVVATARGDDLAEAPDRSAWDDLLRLARYSERATRVLLAAYDDAGTWSDERAARRREAVGRLVDGESIGEDEELVGVRLGGHHLVATVAGSTGTDDPRVVRFAREVSALLPGCTLVTAARTPETLLWWSRAQPVTGPELDRLRAVVVPDGLTVALGDPHPGAPGVAQGYAEARRAASVAAVAQRPGPALHADVLLVSALLADPAATRDLVSRELTGVLGRDARSVELRQTLLLFLRSGGSRQAVAQELGMAPTTVAYRVERFERLRGRRLQESRLETWAALTVVDLAPAVLDELTGSAG
ncbi:PucR C-terminal helix-turn-helix domain-containing protein [Nocardioides lianchengensis]|uniref:PucR C-terminal helix-turn-helix domain-containing protein n=2 Tax=Nocardioides lianchengensis TaxID=1045774 RepID=A0A1G7A094_9ACTN|nr:PucR C-terminal helix-turn-helix domain-containing protein [Nocardioides lianchengensis]